MTARVFASRPLPDPLSIQIRERLEREHRREPFSAVDPRATVRRVVAALTGLDVGTTVYRGGVDLRGTEVDHVWLSVDGEAEPAGSWVIDAAFPLFLDAFVELLRRFVAGDAEPADLAAAAERAGFAQRVVGVFPGPVRYVGQPVWAAR